jgi:hypothetical protein
MEADIMVKIRKGMFETNSSSTHTIIVTYSETKPDFSVDFSIGEFGWSFGRIDTVNRKASYLYTLACDCLGYDVYHDLCAMLDSYDVRCTCSIPAEFEKSSDGQYQYLDNGYVDHCSEGSKFVNRMLSDEEALIRFLFSDQSFVVTGNDNCYEDEYKWMEDQATVDYPHITYYKGN